MTERGLSFYELDKNSANPVRQIGQSIMFQGKKITLICECSPNILVLATIDVPHFIKVDRETLQVSVIEDTSQKSTEHGYTDLQLLKGFNMTNFPFMIAKGKHGITLIDVVNEKAFLLFQTRTMQMSLS